MRENSEIKKRIEKMIKEVMEGKEVKRYKLEEMNIFKLGDEISDIIWGIVSNWEPFFEKYFGKSDGKGK